MSVRAIAYRLVRNGRILLRNYRPHQDVVDIATIKAVPKGLQVEARSSLSPSQLGRVFGSGLQSYLQSARRLFVDGLLKRVTNSLTANLRRRTADQLLGGSNSAPFFALVGVSLATGTGIITKEDELEGVCWEIREAVSRMQRNLSKAESHVFESDETVSLQTFQLGPLIAKGSNAVVYAAAKQSNETTTQPTVSSEAEVEAEGKEFPYAVKMMFNYDAESCATTILRSMYRETVPAKYLYFNSHISDLEESMNERSVSLPAHPNIVSMHCVFADRIPDLPGSRSLYPDALPPRINPDGYGRNMSLFLLMKRYDASLRDYVTSKRPDTREGVLLFSQLLEAVAHMNRFGIAHRDLKSDNVLLDLSEGESMCPTLVVTDFGCCLADRTTGLSLPYHTPDTDRGGNASLMAPEVAGAVPSMFSSIDYSKADLWAAGAIAYELFSAGGNPFYRNAGSSLPQLRNTTYREEDLPPLDDKTPHLITCLVQMILARSPNRRPTAELAATICQLYLWAPSAWLQPFHTEPLPASSEILQWLLCLTTKMLCEGRPEVSPMGKRRTMTEYQLIASFLQRTKLSTIRQALTWIQQH